MTENKNVELVEVPELTQRDKVETYFRSTFLLGSFNFERMQSIGFAVSMIPAIKRFYTKKEDQAEAQEVVEVVHQVEAQKVRESQSKPKRRVNGNRMLPDGGINMLMVHIRRQLGII